MRRKTAAREIALQALYAWQLSGGDPAEEARSLEEYQKSDFLSELLRGVPSKAPELEKLIAPHLDREFRRLSPVERAILYIAAYDLERRGGMLGKSFGGTDGYRFVNGVLEKIAQAVRPEEVARSRNLA